MSEVLRLSKMEIQRNRFALLKYCLVVALVCSAISLGFQQFNNNLVPLVLTLIINLVFLFGLNALFLKALKHEQYNVKDFIGIKNYMKAILPLFGIYLAILGGGVLLIQLLVRIKEVVLFLPAILALVVIFFNCINHLTLFMIIQDQKSSFQALKEATRLFFKSKKLILHIVLKTIMLILIGSLIVYAVNVFAYAPQIDAALKSATIFSEELVAPYFSTSLSYMIQSVGMQLVVSYIAIVSGLTYGTYFLQRLNPKRK